MRNGSGSLPALGLVLAFGMATAAAAQAPCEGGVVQNAQSSSKCIDGYWHVVTETEYLCPDGSRQTVTTKEKTAQTCKAGKGRGEGAGENEGGGGGGGAGKKANACTREQKYENEGKDLYFRCTKGKSDTCANSCELWRAKKADGDSEERVAGADTWTKADSRTYKYYCVCK